MSSILIAGLGKTGTTGVYNSVKQAVRSGTTDYALMFEPGTPDALLALGRYQPYRPILTKVMVARLDEGVARYADFDKRIMTVRDPRDVVISRLLFRPLIRSVVRRISSADIDTFLNALREKEKDPTSWSVRALHELGDQLNIKNSAFDAMVGELRKNMRIIDAQSFFVQRYEDFVDGRLDGLSDYLGTTVTNPAATAGSWLSHIPRSMSHGAWKHWYTPSDVEYYGDMFRFYLDRFEYTDTELAPDQQIDPATSSEYLERQLTERKVQVEHRYNKQWSVDQTTEPEQVEQLRQMAEDGDAEAALRLAMVLDAGVAGAQPDRAAAIAAAREGAVRAHVGAMQLLAGWLQDSDDDHAVLEGRMWSREAESWSELVELRSGVETTGTKRPAAGKRGGSETAVVRENARLKRELRKANRAVRKVQRSPEYRAGVKLRPLLKLRRRVLAKRKGD